MSRDFPGTAGNYLSIGDVAAIDITGTALTIAAKVRPDAVSAYQAVVSKLASAAPNHQYELAIDGSGHVHMVISDGTNFDTASGVTALIAGTEHHIAGVKDGTGAGALRAYLDGVQDAAAASSKSIPNGNALLTIGSRPGNTNHFNGRIAELMIWNVALTAVEVAALAHGVSPLKVRPSGLKGWWPLWGVRFPEADLSGNGNGAALVGTVDAADHLSVGPPFPA